MMDAPGGIVERRSGGGLKRNDMISGAHTQTSSRTIIIMERVRKRSVCGRPPDFLVLGEL